MEEESWKRGGYPRMSIERQELLDLHIVSSDHLRNWMVERGAEPERIRVCYTNIDPAEWRPEPELRKRVRRELLATVEGGRGGRSGLTAPDHPVRRAYLRPETTPRLCRNDSTTEGH